MKVSIFNPTALAAYPQIRDASGKVDGVTILPGKHVQLPPGFDVDPSYQVRYPNLVITNTPDASDPKVEPAA